jgi:RNA polymerase subunit RPABC4/transcription elongation factor Spt4
VIRLAAIEAGMRSIGEDGLKKVMSGATTLEEVTRVVYLAEQPGRLCPNCRAYLNQDFDYCTGCGEFVGEHCEHCHKRMSPDWKFCPACGDDGRSRADGNGVAAHENETERRSPRSRNSAPRLKRAS